MGNVKKNTVKALFLNVFYIIKSKFNNTFSATVQLNTNLSLKINLIFHMASRYYSQAKCAMARPSERQQRISHGENAGGCK